MPTMYNTVFDLLKVIVSYFILFFIVPSFFIKFDEDSNHFLDKLYTSIIHSNLVVIILVHILVVLKIYEPFSFFISYIAVIVLYITWMNKRIEKSSEDGINHANEKVVAKILDLWESDLGFRGTVLKGAKAKWFDLRSYIKSSFIAFVRNPIEALAVLAILIMAGYIRFGHSIKHMYYGASDAYVHLAWAKYLGNNKIYTDGVYPYGYNALISAMNKTFLIDPVVIVRFIGALGGMLIVLSVYFILKRNFSNDRIIPLVGLALYVISTELPHNNWRQLSALPQEYAMMLFLPGLHYLNLYFKNFKKYYLILAAEVLAVALFIHLYVGLFVIIGYVIICALNLKSFLNIAFIFRFGLTMAGAGFLGVLPMLVGLASGIELHRLSAQFVIESAGTQGGAGSGGGVVSKFSEPVFALKVLLVCCAILLLISFIRMFFDRNPESLKIVKMNILFSSLSIFLYLQFRATELGIPALMEFSRVGIFLTLTAVVAIALLLDLLDFIKIKFLNYALKIIIIVPICLTMFNTVNFYIPEGARLEYDDAAYAYSRIKKDYPILNWTIISPVEQYQQSLGYGWHYNLWEFVSDVVEGKKSELKVPTDYVFIFVEKYPLNSTQKITEKDAAEPFPESSNAPDKYYTDYNKRRVIQAKAYYWAEEYIKTNDHMQVFMETEVLKVYVIKQDGTKPYNLAQ